MSRDNFNDRLSPGWKSYFDLGQTHYQSSFLSLMSKPIAVNPKLLEIGDVHATRVNSRDFSKEYLHELKGGPVPDVLVVDFFADARFGCVKVDDSLVTNNEWKLHVTEFWRRLSTRNLFNLVHHEEEYLAAFRKAAEEFNHVRGKLLPSTRIVLNGARGVYSYLDSNGVRVKFSKTSMDQLNRRWAKLDEIFLSCVPADLISAVTSSTLADINHPWGPAPYHYEAGFYRAFRVDLLKRVGY